MRTWLSLLFAGALLTACESSGTAEESTSPAPATSQAPGVSPPAAAAPASPATSAPAAPAVAPAEPGAGMPPHKSFRLGPAAAALVSEARRQAQHGEPDQALATLERALRIEPSNPLLWIELGETHEQAGHEELADSFAHKALQLASGDARVQARAWHLIAESLRARGQNAQASEAQARAGALEAQ
ncbi:MAG TPA: tetratricopeptide repeat protein [Steroidobacteraceae bacterium]|nr:tetratricopeptide repeat protein [Steroidobacteraceae bacterium]